MGGESGDYVGKLRTQSNQFIQCTCWRVWIADTLGLHDSLSAIWLGDSVDVGRGFRKVSVKPIAEVHQQILCGLVSRDFLAVDSYLGAHGEGSSWVGG